MKQNMLKKKRGLAPGEIVPLYFDEAFRIMYANPKHLEILTVLLSRILKVDYQDIEGNISLDPLSIPNRTLGEKQTERDVVVAIKKDEKYKLILEVNVQEKFYQKIIDRNLFYAFEVGGSGLVTGESYSDMPYTFVINFNTFFVNKREKVFDLYMLRNEEGDILTQKEKVLNINIAKCKDLWYHNDYQGKFGPIEEDLLLLCAAMVVERQEEFEKILSKVRMKPEIKKMMEGVLEEMIDNEEMCGRYYDYKEERQRINNLIISEEKEISFKEGNQQGILETQREIVLNMYKEDFSLEMISKISKLSIDVINEIINSYRKNN